MTATYVNFMCYVPVAGRLCLYEETDDSIRTRERCGSLNAYIQTLEQTCQAGSPSILTWTPDENTPDEVFYQVCMYVCMYVCMALPYGTKILRHNIFLVFGIHDKKLKTNNRSKVAHA